MTHDGKKQILISDDAFGAFGALKGGLFDDEVGVSFYEYENMRCFSNSVGKFSPMVQKSMEKGFKVRDDWTVIEPEVEVKCAALGKNMAQCVRG